MINFKRIVQPSIVQNNKDISYALSSLSRNDVKSLLSERLAGGGVFGIEAHKTSNKETLTFFSPPHYKTNWSVGMRDSIFSALHEDIKNTTFIQLFTTKPAFFPVEMNETKSFWKQVTAICPKQISVAYQLLLAFRQDNWKDRLQEQYNDYLDGIEQPSDNKFLRRMQRNINNKLDDLLKWEYKHSSIPELDRKLKENGFRYSIRLAFYGGTKHERNKTINELKKNIENASYTNSWGITNHFISGDIIESIRNRKLDNLGKNQVLSVSELLPFIMSEQVLHIEQPITQSNVTNKRNKATNNPFALLPKGDSIKEVNGKQIAEKFIHALKEIKGIRGEMVAKRTQSGSTLVKVTFDLPKGLRLSEINKKSVIEDLQTHMGMKNLQISQGREVGEIDVIFPLDDRQKAFLRNYVDTSEFQEFTKNNPLPYLVGIDSIGNPIYQCLNKNRHLLIAGTTGSGKSVWVNQMILTLLLSRKPEELLFYMIDVKQVELPIYENFPHVQSVITDADESISLLKQLIKEMNRRYTLFREAEVKNIGLYNKKNPSNILPYIVCVIDEYAELSGRNNDVHDLIQSLTQLSRASGIHLVICTQRPSVDVITGTIKSNLPSKIGFRCSNDHSYRTFLNSKPPYELLGNGDGTMSFEGQMEEHIRFQGCLIIDDPHNDDLESELIRKIAEDMGDSKQVVELPEVLEEEEESELDRLKRVIASTNEVRISQLRELMKININKLNILMKQLVEEGWLEAPETRQSGYKLITNEEELARWKK